MAWERVILGMIVDSLLRNIIVAAILLAAGIGLGLLVKYILNKIVKRAEFNPSQKSFVSLFISLVKWSIFILFLNFALIQLGIPQFTAWLTSILVVIPAVVGALVLIGMGFAVASYLKEVVEDSRISGWHILSQILFIFVNYVFAVFAFKTALISFDKAVVNYLLLILTAALALGYVLWFSRKKR